MTSRSPAGSPARPRLSRRAILALSASGAALASAAVWRRREADAEAARPADATLLPLVDHEGWIVTPEDKEALARADRTP